MNQYHYFGNDKIKTRKYSEVVSMCLFRDCKSYCRGPSAREI